MPSFLSENEMAKWGSPENFGDGEWVVFIYGFVNILVCWWVRLKSFYMFGFASSIPLAACYAFGLSCGRSLKQMKNVIFEVGSE